MRCRSFSHRLRSRWHVMSSLSRGSYTAASMIAASAGGVLMLVPAGMAWPNLSFADALVSAAILDWVKSSLGLMFLLRRRLHTKNGG